MILRKIMNHLIHVAIIDNNLSLLKRLCQNKDMINAYHDDRITPLYRACTLQNLDAIKILIEYKADPNLPVGSGNVLHYACDDRNRQFMLDTLLKYSDIDLNFKDSVKHETLLETMLKRWSYKTELIDKFIDAGSDICIDNMCYLVPLIQRKNLNLLLKLLLNTTNLSDIKNMRYDVLKEFNYVKWLEGIVLLLHMGCNIGTLNTQCENIIMDAYRDYLDAANKICSPNFTENRTVEDNFNFYMDLTGWISKYNRPWTPDMNKLYPLSQMNVYHWMLLRHRLKTMGVRVPNGVSHIIINFIIGIDYFDVKRLQLY